MVSPGSTLRWIGDRRDHEGFAVHHRLRLDQPVERAALLEGLFATPARIAPKYFYDAIGCALFEAICALPEYYPTRIERSILTAQREAIARVAGRRKQLVDLGAGDGAKAALLMPALSPRRYIAVDIAAPAIVPALSRLAADFPQTALLGVVTDFSRELDLDDVLERQPTTFFYPGSSIGNFTPDEARAFLIRIRERCGPGSGLLIGVDTRKDPARLQAAYDDAIGVTAAFNRNILRHVNAVADADFDPAAFDHVALYDPGPGRIEMHLEACAPQRVRIGEHVRAFAAGERIHTESSYKYAPDEFRSLLASAGFGSIATWQDAVADFAVYYAAP
jgi:dimethylhistidine N-methyltransferase